MPTWAAGESEVVCRGPGNPKMKASLRSVWLGCWLLAVLLALPCLLRAQSFSPPYLSPLAEQVTYPGAPTPAIPFTVWDAETPASNLLVSAVSSDANLVPAAGLVLGGGGSNRSLTITPAAGQRGLATITVSVHDWQGGTKSGSFLLRVEEFTEVPLNLAGFRNGDAAWGDYDNDGDLDLLTAGYDSSLTRRIKLYRNDGGGLFTEVALGLPGMSHGALAWGDYDRDGYLDILISGELDGISSRVYRNNGDGGFTLAAYLQYSGIGSGADSASWGDGDGDGALDALVTGGGYARLYRNEGGVFTASFYSAPFPDMLSSASAWVDYDRDGHPDVVISGSTAGGNVTILYHNDGTGGFTNSGIAFAQVGAHAVAWGDYNNDGYPDLVMTGWETGVGEFTRVLRNDGGTNFTDINAGLLGVMEGSVAWGDYDNDGDLDLLVTGGTGTQINYSGHYTRVYRNDNGTFVDIGAPLMGVAMGTGIWADYDNDGDLDFFVTGITSSIGYPYAKLYRNNHSPNQRPNSPASASVTVRGSSVAMTWAAATDPNQAAALTYNVRVGTTAGAVNVLTPMANPTNGFRRLPADGNMGTRLSFAMTNLSPGTYFAAVQAVDHTYAGSDFSPEASFTITKPGISDIPDQVMRLDGPQSVAFTVSASGTSLETLSLSASSSDTNVIPNGNILFSGSGSNRTIIMSARRGGTTVLSVTVTDTNGGYATDAFSVRVDEFMPLDVSFEGMTADFALPADYNNDSFMDLLICGNVSTGRVSRVYLGLGDGTFTNSLLELPPGPAGQAAWGDFNNDGYLDLALGGTLGSSNVVRIFRNEGGLGFTDSGVVIAGTDAGSRLAWGDYDNDGDLDLVVTSPTITRIFKNTHGAFADSGVNLPGVSQGSVALGDYDNDGDLDVLLSGSASGGIGPMCRIYQNNGAGRFTVVSNSLPGIYLGNAAWGDYDNDGKLDIALCGYAMPNYVLTCAIYHSLGGGEFTNVANLEGFIQGMVAWGDSDNDGDLDLVAKGASLGYGTRLYRNNGDHTFTSVENLLPGMYDTYYGWADLDNDGDLDLTLAGNTNFYTTTYGVFVFRNNQPTHDSAPTAPGSLAATLLPENNVLLTWSPGSDAETINAAGLNYNLRLGTAPGAINEMSPQADPASGLRRLAALGNAGPARQYLLVDVPRGAHYWSVQSIDPAFAGSPFALEASFVITNGRPTLSAIANQTIFPNHSTGPIPFVVDDVETPASNLVVTASSSDTNFVPNENIIFSGTGSNRFVTLTPVGTANGTTVITMVVTDSGGLSATNAFSLSLEQFTLSPVQDTFSAGSVSWMDYDNDGNLDLLLTGQKPGGGPASELYRNMGDGTLSAAGSPVAGAYNGSVDIGDFDNDGYVDVLLSGYVSYSTGPITRVYRNLGNGQFASIITNIPGVYQSAVAWADYDGDGRLDILVTGSTNGAASGAMTRLYRNAGAGRFIEQATVLPAVFNGAVAWGDYDNDGDLDLVLSGTTTNSASLTGLYRNDGAGNFTVAATFTGSSSRSVAWGDFDNDGYLDLLLGSSQARVLHNDGNNAFTELSPALQAVNYGAVAWGDFDNDGRLDILVSGGGSSRIYRNNGDGTFSDARAGLPPVSSSAAAWADIDGDGDLDFAVIGTTNGSSSGSMLGVYRNNYNQPNTPPLAPTGLTATPAARNNRVGLAWLSASDAQTTNSSGLGYNLRVGTAPGAADVMSPHANVSTGQRRLARLGNAGPTNQWVLSNLEKGTYYWSVQAIDTAFAASPFAAEESFTITNARPTISAIPDLAAFYNAPTTIPFVINDLETAPADLVLAARSSNTNLIPNENLSFEGSGTNRNLVLRVAGTNGASLLTVSVTDAAGAYALAAFTVTVQVFTPLTTALPPVQNSSLAWGDFDNDGDLDVLVTGRVTNYYQYTLISRIYRNEGNGLFTNLNVSLPGVEYSAVAWGDYDNDGDLDFVLTGSTNSSASGAITRLYRNNGDGSFTLAASLLPAVSHSSVAWGDYDNDGDPDLLIAGAGNSGYNVATLYRNNGNGSFTSGLTIGASASYPRAVAWADYDNDGRLDFFVSGMGATTLYRNKGGVFVPSPVVLPNLAGGSAAWGDYDQDGDLDLLLSGLASSGTNLTRIYRNDGNSIFTHAFSLLGVQSSSAAWGDYDGDGFLDVLMNGSTNSYNGVVARVYRSNRATNFTDVGANLQGAYVGSVAWVDYDRDGDLDACLSGSDGIYYSGGYSAMTRLYRNNSAISNTPPLAPTALGATVGVRSVDLTWARSSDAETTNALGLGYSLRVGTTPGGGQIVAPQADVTTGLRRVLAMGGIPTNRWCLYLLPGTYYWSVQAVDPSLAGSPFAAEAQFVLPNVRPFASSQVIVMSEDTARTITLSGSDPDGQTMTYSLLSAPAHGTLTGTLPSLSYRPVTNYFGADSFTFQVTDGMTNSLPATVSLVITQVQDVAIARLALAPVTNGQVRLLLVGEPYERYRIEASQDFVIWVPLTNLLFTNLNMEFVDPDAASFTHRFYRSAWVMPEARMQALPSAPAGPFKMAVAGDVGRTYRVLASTNLSDWILLTNLVLTNTSTPFTDPQSALFDRRFYRVTLSQ